jgi:hypothetical protein
MPGQQFHTEAIILGRLPSGSDKFEQLNGFSATDGPLTLLRRVATKAATASPPIDLFDEVELWLESSTQGRTWFIKEHRHLARRPGLGRSYEALATAARFAHLLQRNPVADESRGPILALLRQALTSLESGARPDLVWLKALFCFLRDEGYPVKQHWWPQLAAPEREAASRLLNQPLAVQNPDAIEVARLTTRLETWVATDTELRLK